MSSPTISLPRARMSATAASASALVAKGRRLAVGSQSWLELSGGSGGCGGMISMPTGVGSGSVGVASTPSVSEWPQLASTIAKASGASGAAARARRARRVITDTLSAGATGRARRQWRHLS